MLSRVAESIYWMARQVERAENMARFLEVTHQLMLDQPEGSAEAFFPLVRVTGDEDFFWEHYPVANQSNVLSFVAFDRRYHSSIITSLAWARQNARGVREVLSSEIYEAISDLYHYVAGFADQPGRTPDDFLIETRRLVIQFSGVVDATMPRDLAWHFMTVGRGLERADKTSRILDVKYFQLLPDEHSIGTAVDDLQWATVLRACSAIEAYRREHQHIDVSKVVDFLMFHRHFPRSILFAITRACESLRSIDRLSGRPSDGDANQQISDLCERLESLTPGDVIAFGMHEFVDDLQSTLNDVGSAVGRENFHRSDHAIQPSDASIESGSEN